jgi:ABC-type multidrug transport system ATPase subunit
MIDAENLMREIGDFTVMENLTLHFDDGEVLGLLSPNGAGKTKIVRMLSC